MVNEHGDWDLAVLSRLCPPKVLKRFNAILHPSVDHGGDRRIWPGNRLGLFSVAGAYELLGGFLHLEKADVWNKVWKLHVMERVWAFIWQITHEKLLTNAQKHQWGLGAPLCPHCPNELETILHTLRDCSLAMTVWNQLVRPSDRGAFYLEDLEDWISSNLTKNLGSGSVLEWASLWGFTCHQLWQWRNKFVHVPSFRRSPYHGCMCLNAIRSINM